MSKDFELVKRAVDGDESAFTELYKGCHQKVLRVLLRMTHGNMDDAEDLVQETFIKAFQKLHLYRGTASFSTWVHRIAVNSYLMKRRSLKCEYRVMAGSIDDIGNETVKERMSNYGRRDGALESVVDYVALRKWMEDVTAERQQILTLHYVDGYTCDQLGEMFARSKSAIKAEVFRVKLHLRSMSKPVSNPQE